MNTKKLIVIEGACDGIGKSTQFALLKEKLSSMGIGVASHHFPSYGTYHGAPVEAYLKGDLGTPDSLSPYFVNSLYAIDRAVTWQSILKTKSEDGSLILLDRYTTSSLIYQSALITDKNEKDTFIDYVTDFEYNKLAVPEPDLVIFLDAPFETATSLRSARESNEGIEHDIHEVDTVFMKAVYDSAQYVCDRLSWKRISCTDSDGKLKSREDIHAAVFSAVREILGE